MEESLFTQLPTELIKTVKGNLDTYSKACLSMSSKLLHCKSVIRLKHLIKYGNDNSLLENANVLNTYSKKSTVLAIGYNKLRVFELLSKIRSHISITGKYVGECIPTIDFACKLDRLEIVKYLIEHNLTLNTNSLDFAVQGKNIELVQYCLTYDLRLENYHLTLSAKSGCIPMFEYIFNQGLTIEKTSKYPLIAASKKGRFEMIKYLLPFTNITPEINTDVTRYICRLGRLDIIEYLIEQNFTVDHICVAEAVISNNFELVKYLCKLTTPKISSVNRCIGNNRVDILDYILSIINVQLKDDNLLDAVKFGYLDMIKYLINKGLTIKDTYLGYAISSRKIEVVSFIVKSGIVVTESNFESACSFSTVEIVKYLLSKGDFLINTHLSTAIRQNNPAVVNYLREYKLTTALQKNYSNGYLESIRSVVESGAIPTSEHVMVAANKGYFELVKYFVEKTQFKWPDNKDYNIVYHEDIFIFLANICQPPLFYYDIALKTGRLSIVNYYRDNQLVRVNDLNNTIQTEYRVTHFSDDEDITE